MRSSSSQGQRAPVNPVIPNFDCQDYTSYNSQIFERPRRSDSNDQVNHYSNGAGSNRKKSDNTNNNNNNNGHNFNQTSLPRIINPNHGSFDYGQPLAFGPIPRNNNNNNPISNNSNNSNYYRSNSRASNNNTGGQFRGNNSNINFNKQQHSIQNINSSNNNTTMGVGSSKSILSYNNQISGEYSQNSNNNGAFKSLTRNTGSGFQRTQLTMRQNDSNGNLSYNSNYVENQGSVNRYLSTPSDTYPKAFPKSPIYQQNHNNTPSTPQPILDNNQSSNNFAMSKFPEKSSNKNYRNVRPNLPSQSEIFSNQQKVQGVNLNDGVENRDLRMRSNDQLFLNSRKTSQGDHVFGFMKIFNL